MLHTTPAHQAIASIAIQAAKSDYAVTFAQRGEEIRPRWTQSEQDRWLINQLRERS